MKLSRSVADVYQPRNPRASNYFRCIDAHFEQLEMLWDDRYANQYGFWRPYVKEVIYRYLNCGDLHFGFARVKCKDCGNEYLLPFSCKRRHFCPSCHQKRVIEFGGRLCEDVLKYVPHRQWVFSIPKRLRIYFMFDRSLLAKLSQCGWYVLSGYLRSGISYEDAVAGGVIAVQTFGDFQNFNPHLHIIATDGCFYGNGGFMVGPKPSPNDLENAFRREVFKMLKNEGKINDFVIENMMNWHHSGFNAYCGEAIWPQNEEGLENLARYVIRASFSQERMIYIPASDCSDGAAKVLYESKDGNTQKAFDALDWLALLTTHIPNRGEQMVRYYGFYSNKSRGLRKKAGIDNEVPALIESDVFPKQFRKSWARLIQKVYNVDPLLCPKCQGAMRIISFIEDNEVVEKILRYLGLWETRSHDPPIRGVPHIHEFTYDGDYSQIPSIDYWLQ